MSFPIRADGDSMSNFAVDGLSSGLDTTSIIEQLMAVERQPIVRLENRRGNLNQEKSAWSDLDTRLNTLTEAIDALRDDAGINALVGEASNPDIPVTRTGDGAVGVYEATVEQIATTHQYMSGSFASPTDLVGAGRATITSGVEGIGATYADPGASDTGHYTVQVTGVADGTATIVFNGETHEVDSSSWVTLTNDDGATMTLNPDGEFKVGTAYVSTMVTDASTTVGAMAVQLSDPGGAATVQVVDTGDDEGDAMRLVVTARAPGTDNALSVDVPGGAVGTMEQIREATNTIVRMGDGDLVIERSDVNVDGLVPGMTVDLSSAEVGEDLRVTVSRDSEAVVEKVRAFIDAANAVFSGISSYGQSDPESGRVGLLSGESSLRRLEQQLREGFAGVGTGTYVVGSQVGFDGTRDGTVNFDEDTFAEVLAADFAGLQNFLLGDDDDGYLGRIETAIDTVTENQGVIENATTNLDASLDDIDDTIERYERRMEVVEAGLRRQFTAMETLLAQLNSQSSFLATQL
jgi:flagellar hook-associated protein 2